MIIAIDGPAGSGKTTVAKNLAKKLNISYLDTGAIYRALTLKALQLNLNLSDQSVLKRLAESIGLKIERDKVYLDREDVSKKIRTPLIDKNISLVVSYPEVREVMVRLQRVITADKDFVVEGRDITTVVFPDTEFKFYLDADSTVRAKRRFKELTDKEINVNYQEIQEDLKRRDHADKSRKISPLKISPDAKYIDTTNLSIEETTEIILDHIKNTNKR